MSWHIERRTIFANSLNIDLLWRALGGKARRLADDGDVEVCLHTLLHTCCYTFARTCIYELGMGIDKECTIIVFIHLLDRVVLRVVSRCSLNYYFLGPRVGSANWPESTYRLQLFKPTPSEQPTWMLYSSLPSEPPTTSTPASPHPPKPSFVHTSRSSTTPYRASIAWSSWAALGGYEGATIPLLARLYPLTPASCSTQHSTLITVLLCCWLKECEILCPCYVWRSKAMNPVMLG